MLENQERRLIADAWHLKFTWLRPSTVSYSAQLNSIRLLRLYIQPHQHAHRTSCTESRATTLRAALRRCPRGDASGGEQCALRVAFSNRQKAAAFIIQFCTSVQPWCEVSRALLFGFYINVAPLTHKKNKNMSSTKGNNKSLSARLFHFSKNIKRCRILCKLLLLWFTGQRRRRNASLVNQSQRLNKDFCQVHSWKSLTHT